MKVSKLILPVIIFSQFVVTSLWFTGNAIIADLQSASNVGIVREMKSLSKCLQS